MLPLLLLTLTTAAGPAMQVQTLSGETVAGSLVELSGQQIGLDTPSGRVTLDIEKLASLTPADAKPMATPEGAVWVELVDGSSLVGTAVTTTGDKAQLTLAGGRSIELPSHDVLSVRLQAQVDATAAEWARLQESEATSDLLVVRKGASLDFHRGILREITPAVVRFEVDGEVLPVKREKVFALVVYQAGVHNLPQSICHIADTSGSVWDARSISLAENQLQWTTPLGLEIKRPWSDLAKIDFSQGKIVYLSDLKPDSVEWTPFLGSAKTIASRAEFFRPRTDQSLRGGPLELDGKSYQKGLALHSRTTMVYRLPGRFHRFKAIAGIDDRVRPRGNVQLVIRGDDQTLLKVTVAGSDPPQVIDVDLNGVRRLTILVDFGEDLDVADHLDLCEARIVK